jgi:hypothetical protein
MSNLPAHQQIANTLQVSGRYTEMLERITDGLPAVAMDSENFHKSASQFKTVTLDVVDLTPINSAKHLLAVINRTRQALEEAQISLRRKRLDAEEARDKASRLTGFERERALVDADEAESHVLNIEASARGAIRKLHYAMTQYQQILDRLGVDHLTEEDYEKDQIRYHIMTAFNQALTAARAKGGWIDEGNQIYLFQLGINGAVAQAEVFAFLQMEENMLKVGQAPTHEMILDWLNKLADRFAGAPIKYAENRGFTPLDRSSLIELENR